MYHFKYNKYNIKYETQPHEAEKHILFIVNKNIYMQMYVIYNKYILLFFCFTWRKVFRAYLYNINDSILLWNQQYVHRIYLNVCVHCAIIKIGEHHNIRTL